MNKSELIKEVNKLGNKEKVCRLYTCNAYIYKGLHSDNYVLRSYNTYVAVYNKSTGTAICFDFYSMTTQQHFNKFISWIEENVGIVMRATYLYKRSDRYIELSYRGRANSYRLSSKQWKNVENNGFIGYIPTTIL